MSVEFDGSILKLEKGRAKALDLVRFIKDTHDYDLITYVIDEKRAYDEYFDDVDLVFEMVCIEALGLFGDFVRINGEIRLVTDVHLQFSDLRFRAYSVTQEVADLVEKNIDGFKLCGK